MFFRKLSKPTNGVAKTIEQIHGEFNSAADNALSEAKRIIATADETKMSKAERLKKLGFHQSADVAQTSEILQKKKEHDHLMTVIMDYSVKYPNNKFITEAQVKQICEKYKLICGEIGLFKGFVPESKLQMIEAFSVKDEDVKKEVSTRDWSDYHSRLAFSRMPNYFTSQQQPSHERPKAKPVGLMICAPSKDFDLSRMDVVGYKLVEKHIPDPVVLQPVKHGYLIVAAWGDEASDELVVNHKNN